MALKLIIKFKILYYNNVTFKLIFMIPVMTETLENSTALNISIFSENNFWMLLIKLLSMVLKKKVYKSKMTIKTENCSQVIKI